MKHVVIIWHDMRHLPARVVGPFETDEAAKTWATAYASGSEVYVSMVTELTEVLDPREVLAEEVGSLAAIAEEQQGMLSIDEEAEIDEEAWVRMLKAPRLLKLLKEDHIFLKGGKYYGYAEDGIVTLGNEGKEEDLEKFLAQHPVPKGW